MTITLYKLDISPPARSCRIVADMIGVEYNVVDVNLLAGEHKTPEYLKKNPQHTIPMLEDGDFTIWDSHAISIYLVQKYAKDDSLFPKDPKIQALINQRLHFDSGVMFTKLRDLSAPIFYEGKTSIGEVGRNEVDAVYDMLEKILNERKYLAADHLTLADILCSSTTCALISLHPIDQERFPNIYNWMHHTLNEDPIIKKYHEMGYKEVEIMNRERLDGNFSK